MVKPRYGIKVSRQESARTRGYKRCYRKYISFPAYLQFSSPYALYPCCSASHMPSLTPVTLWPPGIEGLRFGAGFNTGGGDRGPGTATRALVVKDSKGCDTAKLAVKRGLVAVALFNSIDNRYMQISTSLPNKHITNVSEYISLQGTGMSIMMSLNSMKLEGGDVATSCYYMIIMYIESK